MVCIHLMALLRGPGMERSLLVLGQVAMGLHSSSQPQCAKGDGLSIHTRVDQFHADGDVLRPLVRQGASNTRGPDAPCRVEPVPYGVRPGAHSESAGGSSYP